MMNILVISSFLLMLCFPSISTQPMVNTKLGPIRGFRTKLKSGRDLYAFTRIPFALPLIGRLWNKAPVPVTSLEPDNLQTASSNNCSQSSINSSANLTGNTYCLTLNVYSHNLTDRPSFPVIFWLRSTVIKELSDPDDEELSDPDDEEPEKLMKPNTILVTSRFRHGFIDHFPTAEKLKLLDQALALQWVYNHIMNFGGDPKKLLLAYPKNSDIPKTLLRLIMPFFKDVDQNNSMNLTKKTIKNETQPKIQKLESLTEFIKFDDPVVQTDLNKYKYVLLDQWPENMIKSIYHNAKKKVRQETVRNFLRNLTNVKEMPFDTVDKFSENSINETHFKGRKLLEDDSTNQAAANSGEEANNNNGPQQTTAVAAGKNDTGDIPLPNDSSKLKITAIWVILHLPFALSM